MPGYDFFENVFVGTSKTLFNRVQQLTDKHTGRKDGVVQDTLSHIADIELFAGGYDGFKEEY